MSTLILVFHPHLKDGSRVNARLLAELTAQGEDDIIVRDEYAEYPNFSVNADTEHELLEAADRVILQFPFYWYSSPALLKEWEDEVITARLGLRRSPRVARARSSNWWSPLVPTPPSTARTASTATPWRSC